MVERFLKVLGIVLIVLGVLSGISIVAKMAFGLVVVAVGVILINWKQPS